MPFTDVLLAVLSQNELASQNRVIDALRSRGATSPASARPQHEFNVAADETWNKLLMDGRIREGAPGQFYLFEPRRASPRRRVIRTLVFWVFILLIPIALVFLTRTGQ